jgi:hypothetical protein
MSTHPHRPVESLFRFATCLGLAGVLSSVGCNNSGEGTVQVSREARARLTPRVPVVTRGPKGRRIVGERPIGIKNPGVAGKTTP